MKKVSGLAFLTMEKWLPAILSVAALLSWEIQSRAGWVSPLFFPAPSTIALAFLQLLYNGKLLSHVWPTLSRIFLGLAIGGVPALLLGLSMGWSQRVRGIVDPFVAAIHPMPKISLLPLIMIFFGIGEASKVVVVALAAFFPMLINTMAGVRQISPIYYEVAENYGASLLHLFTRVVLPGSLPMMMSGIRLALNMAFVITIATELVAAKEGLGAMVWFAWQTLRIEELYVSLGVTALLGIGFNSVLQWLGKRLIPWQMERVL